MHMRHLYTTSILILSLFFLAPEFSLAQNKFNKEQQRDLEEADYYYYLTDYLSALEIYNKLYEIDKQFPELNYKIGVCKFELKDDRLGAYTYFLQAAGNGVNDAHYYVGRCLHLKMELGQAIETYRKYLNLEGEKNIEVAEVERQILICENAQAMVASPTPAKVKNLGPTVNTEHSEYVPVIPADGSKLYFTSRRPGSTGGLIDPRGQPFEDVYHTELKDGTWTSAQQIEGEVNTETHDACVGLSSDGKLMIVYRTNKAMTGGDLYWSVKKDGKWTDPEKFGPFINTKYQEASASITLGNYLYFSSNRPGGYGGRDIYRVIRFASGHWSLPVNLGPSVNSPYNEDAPFIHPDGKTLYFSSKGHNTMGGYDIFKTEMTSDGGWKQPENMGSPINTVEDDIYFVMTSDGTKGFYSSNREGGMGGQDIYQIDIPDNKIPVTVIRSTVTDKAGKPLMAYITVEPNNNSGETQGVYSSNSDGKVIMVIPPNQEYLVMVEADGYEMQTEKVFFSSGKGYQEIDKSYKLKPAN